MSYTIVMYHVFPEDNIACVFWSLCERLVFKTNASRSGILTEAISSFKNEEVLALCIGDTFHVQFVE